MPMPYCMRKMAKRRVVQKKRSTKEWGVQNTSQVVRKRKDGSSYIEYRHPYYVQCPVVADGQTVGCKKVRKWAASSVSPSDAKAIAERRQQDALAHEPALNSMAALTSPQREVVAKASASPVLKRTLIQCAEEYMTSRKRYREKRVVGHQFGYRKKQNGYISTIKRSDLDSMPLNQLTLAQVVSWFNNEYMPSHSETTAARFRAWLVSVGHWARRNRYWDENLFEDLPVLSATAPKKDSRIYTVHEIDAMWDSARTPQERALLVLLRCGLRQGECTGLTEEQILDDETIFVKYSLGYEDNIWGMTTPLGNIPKAVPFLHPAKGSSAMKVHIPKDWMVFVKQSLALSVPDIKRAYDDVDGTNPSPGNPIPRRFVLPNRYGLAWGDTCVSEALRNLMVRAGVQSSGTFQTFHAWRHTLASDLLALGCGDMELAWLMRHRDYNLSKSVYASARLELLSSYRSYGRRCNTPAHFLDALAQFDEDRRHVKRGGKPNRMLRSLSLALTGEWRSAGVDVGAD